MPVYNYTAKSFSGEVKSGKIEARDEKDLAGALRQEGYILIYSEIRQRRIFAIPGFGGFGRIRAVEKMIFCRYLALMIKAGLSLTRALEILMQQSKNRVFKKVLSEVREEIIRGKSFSDSLGRHPRVFGELFCSMIKVGEEAGNLEEVLGLLGYQLEKEHELNSRIKGAMIYPAMIFLVMIAVGFVMMIFVMPKLVVTFEELNAPLPMTTRLLIAGFKFLSRFWYGILAIIFGIVFLARFILNTKSGKKAFDTLVLKTPIIKSIIQKINVAKASRTLGSLMKSGVPILRALEITSHTLGNYHYKESLDAVSKNLQKGKGLAESFQQYEEIYPVLFIQMVVIGGETGTLADILKELADFFEEEVSNVTRNLSTIIEPFLLIVMGVVVAFFAVSIMQAIYSSTTYIQ